MIDLPIRVAAPDVTHVDALPPGTRLGEFEILGLLGVGGFGMVYRAYDHSLQRDVAIKEYMPTALASRAVDVLNISVRTSSDQETFRTGLESFVGEARMLAKFEHPSLVKVFRFWEANNTAYMVMPLYRGMTLKQARMRMRTPPTEAWLRKVLWSVLGALKVLHRGKALHRDVSPDNIFLQDIGPPVLLDLGAARLAISDRAKQHTAVLKVNFAPIEQYADVKDMLQGPWTDLYSLSAVVHGMLCNEPPMPATIRVVNDSMPPFASVAKTVAAEFGQRYSAEFVTGIAWGLNIRPQDRPQSVQELARALALTTPNGMSTFDWRAELGPGCLPPGDVLQVPGTPEATDPTQPDQSRHEYQPTQLVRSSTPAHNSEDEDEESPTVLVTINTPTPAMELHSYRGERRAHARSMPEPADFAETPLHADSHVKTEPMALESDEAPTRPRRAYGAWLLASGLGALVLVGAAWSWRSSTKPVTAPMLPVTASAPATPDVPQPGVASATPPSPAPSPNVTLDSAPAAAGAAVVPATSAASAVAPSSPASAQVGANDVASPAPADGAAKPAPAVTERAVKAAKPAPPRRTTAAPPKVEPPVAAVEPTPAPAPAPAAPPPAPPKPVVTAEKLCASESFFSKPMCMYRACQRADLAGTPFCVEQEQRFKRAAESNNPVNR